MSGDKSDAGGNSPASTQGSFEASSSPQTERFQFRAELDMGSIATKAERDHLVANRPKPDAEMHLTPDTLLETSVKDQVNQAQERRIQKLTNSLNLARERLHQGVEYSANAKPPQDHGHER